MPTPEILDESTAYDRARAYSYTRIVDLGGRRVRARVHCDYYRFQSWARAEVLTDALAWTLLAEADPATWHDQAAAPTGRRLGARAQLAPVAEQLIDRAAAILP